MESKEEISKKMIEIKISLEVGEKLLELFKDELINYKNKLNGEFSVAFLLSTISRFIFPVINSLNEEDGKKFFDKLKEAYILWKDYSCETCIKDKPDKNNAH